MSYNGFLREANVPDLMPDTRFPVYSASTSHYNRNQDLDGRIDPLLEASAQYSNPQLDLHDASNIQRFLQGPNTSFFAASHHYPVQNTSFIYQDMAPSVSPGHQFRHSSPASYKQSSTTSGAHSPPLTDNDPYVDSTQGPSTPPDVAILSPHIGPRDSQSPRLALTGLNVPPGCVIPAAVQPGQYIPDLNDKETLGDLSVDSDTDTDSITPTVYQQDPSYSSPYSSMDTHNPGVDIKPQPSAVYPELGDANMERLDYGVAVDHRSSGPDDGGQSKTKTRGKLSRAAKANTRRPKRPDSATNDRKTKVSKPSSASRNGSNRKILSSTVVNTKTCPHCDLGFSDNGSLQKHINVMHKRPFICVFHFAGCDKIFANKNEWKRHVWAQHLNLHYWLCTNGTCGYSSNQDEGSATDPTHGRIFRRKDLFTQHIRRMHAPEAVAKAGKKDKNLPADWVAKEKAMQTAAARQRCELPTHMRCPAEGCRLEFNNHQKTWDNRMEHVAIHLERAANNEEPPVVFGGVGDEALTDWASSVQVIEWGVMGGWKMCQPLKAARVEISQLSNIDDTLDEDAEGEECY
ncbi:c2h2 finger [Fusarium albosuccineum]|uniref:C2h2 finger n=1 Tax=Fusarium albosuccineum TaxID=1237068 RepID=A0A8H4KXJ2_9HYPO|nr:c2h2 finger [Fusarium albosuccineum]